MKKGNITIQDLKTATSEASLQKLWQKLMEWRWHCESECGDISTLCTSLKSYTVVMHDLVTKSAVSVPRAIFNGIDVN